MKMDKEAKELMEKEIKEVNDKYAASDCENTATRVGQGINEIVRILYKYGYESGFEDGYHEGFGDAW